MGDSQIVDAQIVAGLREISAQRIQANIEKLVSFGTRATLSAQDPASIAAGRGIGSRRSSSVIPGIAADAWK